MILPITRELRIQGTRYAWEVQQAKSRKHRRTGKRETHWVSFQWYSSLPSALKGVVELRLRLASTATLAGAVVEAKRIAEELGNALASAGNANLEISDGKRVRK